MRQRRILYLDSTQLSAYRVGGGSVQADGEFAATASGITAFAAYLTDHRDSIFMLLCDSAEEGFQREEIPHSWGKDRTALIHRKLAQHFPGTPFAVARTLGRRTPGSTATGRSTTGRRDEHLLLLALSRPQHLAPWLAALRAAAAILVGIYSVAQTLVGLLPRQTPSRNSPAQVLLITLTRSGLRQTFVSDRQLCFSRLTSFTITNVISPDTAWQDESAHTARREALRMHQYLLSQGLIADGTPLATWILVHPDQQAAMRAHCCDTAELQFDCIDLLQAAQRTGLHTPPDDSRSDALFCHLLAQRQPTEQFAPAAERQYHRLWKIRTALSRATGLILASGLLSSALLASNLLQLQDSSGAIEQQTRRDQQRYDTTLQALPKIPLSTDNLRMLVDRYEDILQRASGPAPLLIQLSASLEAFPDIAIERIEWSLIEPVAGTASPIFSPTAASPTAITQPPHAQAIVAARLPLEMVGDQRGQLALVARFAAHLGTPAHAQVTVLQQPVDAQSGQTLKSSDETHAQDAPRFSFRLTGPS